MRKRRPPEPSQTPGKRTYAPDPKPSDTSYDPKKKPKRAVNPDRT
jgi:hypothetical protein